MEYAEAEYKRQEELARENVNAGKTLQAAKAEYTSLKARVAGLEAKTGGQRARLELLGIDPDRLSPDNFQSEISLYSPTNGYVTEVNVNAGKYVGSTEVMFKIADTEHLHAELTVFEKDILKLKVGQKVRFMLANETRERRGHHLSFRTRNQHRPQYPGTLPFGQGRYRSAARNVLQSPGRNRRCSSAGLCPRRRS
ncbi:MAG: efflux RND transporter periplasmic adaptor subunit [Saprospirales bacterium]|nr:efflux RND transporter periplasmic adaptor subunit [Saprospirales bacterium]